MQMVRLFLFLLPLFKISELKWGSALKKKSFSVRNSLYGNQALNDTEKKKRVPNVLNGWFGPPWLYPRIQLVEGCGGEQ